MEQRLDGTYLRSGPFERAAAIGISAVAIGTGILLAAWGISLLWRYTPPEIVIRGTVVQEKPFVFEPLKIDPGQLTLKVEPQSPATSGVAGSTKTSTGDVIEREVTVFSNVRHGPGVVVTGWNYRDGSGGTPVQQYCYYTTPNIDHSSKRVDIASNRVRSPNLDPGLLPDLEGALAKCQWWQG
jgi:hypothetical protein